LKNICSNTSARLEKWKNNAQQKQKESDVLLFGKIHTEDTIIHIYDRR